MSNPLNKIRKASISLIKIPSGSPKFYLLLFPPIYMFWSIALINIVFRKGKNLMTFFALSMSLIALLLIAFYAYGLLQHLPFIKSDTFKMIYSYYVVLWVFFCLVVSHRSLKYEEARGISKPNLVEYFVRFFVLGNWYIGMWSFQSIVREYGKIDDKTKL